MCLASLGTYVKGVQLYCPSRTYAAIPFCTIFPILAHWFLAKYQVWTITISRSILLTYLDLHYSPFYLKVFSGNYFFERLISIHTTTILVIVLYYRIDSMVKQCLQQITMPIYIICFDFHRCLIFYSPSTVSA